jgi:hypothetical protein
MSARAATLPRIGQATAPWNKGTPWRVSGHIAATVDITIEPVFYTNPHTFFTLAIVGGAGGSPSGGASSGGTLGGTTVPSGNSVWTVVEPVETTWTEE